MLDTSILSLSESRRLDASIIAFHAPYPYGKRCGVSNGKIMVTEHVPNKDRGRGRVPL